MRELVMCVAGPYQPSDTRQSRLARAARKAGITYSQVRKIWYGQITDENHRSVRLLMDAAERQQQEKEGRNDRRELEERIARIERYLRTSDPDFHWPSIDAFGPRN